MERAFENRRAGGAYLAKRVGKPQRLWNLVYLTNHGSEAAWAEIIYRSGQRDGPRSCEATLDWFRGSEPTCAELFLTDVCSRAMQMFCPWLFCRLRSLRHLKVPMAHQKEFFNISNLLPNFIVEYQIHSKFPLNSLRVNEWSLLDSHLSVICWSRARGKVGRVIVIASLPSWELIVCVRAAERRTNLMNNQVSTGVRRHTCRNDCPELSLR